MLSTVHLHAPGVLTRQALLRRSIDEERREIILDRALEDSFPASDPIAANTFN